MTTQQKIWNEDIFTELYHLNLADYIEKDWKKPTIRYLSWANAYQILLKHDPHATYEVVLADDHLPFFSRQIIEPQFVDTIKKTDQENSTKGKKIVGLVHFVFTKVHAFNITKSMYLPVMDAAHRGVAMPDSRQINDAIMRCLAKNIALFGIGLYLYTGEDITQYKQQSSEKKKLLKELDKLFSLQQITETQKKEWLLKANVDCFAAMPESYLKKLINLINKDIKKEMDQDISL